MDAAEDRCPTDRVDERVVSALVFDGDTLLLEDGRKVRLLGINTPEMGDDDSQPQPYAEAAKTFLEELAGPASHLQLRLDQERHDRYGRVLAHVFRDDGVNVQERLLASGYATTLVVPPNAWGLECYASVEARARGAGVGIWGLTAYQPVAAEDLLPEDRGYRIVTGRVQRIGEGRHNLWLNLAAHMAVRIPKKDLVNFGELPPRQLLDRQLEVRGWIQRRRGELRLTVRHPAALRVLD